MKKIFPLKLQLQTAYITFFQSSLFLFSCLALTLSSCNQCDDKQEGPNLGGFRPSTYGAFMPSNPFTTLKLLKNGTDTIQFVGQGREEWVEEASRSVGNCPIYYKLLNHRVNFTNITEGTNHLVLRYNQYGEAITFDDHIEYKFGNSAFLNYRLVYLGDTSTLIKNFKNINGTEQDALLIRYKKDTIYIFRNNVLPLDMNIARIKYGTDVYELVQ